MVFSQGNRVWQDTIVNSASAGDLGPVRELPVLFENILGLLQAPYSPEGCCDTAAKRNFLERFQRPAFTQYTRSLEQVPEPLLDLLYACLSPSCQHRPIIGEVGKNNMISILTSRQPPFRRRSGYGLFL